VWAPKYRFRILKEEIEEEVAESINRCHILNIKRSI